MEQPTCWTCSYRTKEGYCHRHAPSPLWIYQLEDGHDSDSVGWPEVEDEDFCGEHPDFPAYIESLKTVTPRDR